MVANEKGFVDEIPGRAIIKSAGYGKWIPADVENLGQMIRSIIKNFGQKRWGYIADPTRMDPLLSKETSAAFSALYRQLESEGCFALAFLDSNTSGMKLISQMHHNDSDTSIEVLHFENEAQALEWMKELGL